MDTRTHGWLSEVIVGEKVGHRRPGSPPRASMNGYAIASLVLSLVSLSGIGSILAIVCGNMEKRQIRTEGGEGSGLATAGIIIGWVGLVLVSVDAIFFFGFVLNSRATRT